MEEKSSTGRDKLMKCIKAPVRALCKARDFYVKSINNCANNMNYGVYAPSTLPRSFSVTSARLSTSYDNDLREAMRVEAGRRLRLKAGDEAGLTKGLPAKSYSLAIGRIDEDEPCYFEDDNKKREGMSFNHNIKRKSWWITMADN